MAKQSYGNHTRVNPIFHYGVLGALIANVLWASYRLLEGAVGPGGPTGDGIVHLLTAIAVLTMAVSLRTQALTVQDRVIRLETQLRFRDLLSPAAAARAADLPVKQLVAIRFASDEELPALVDDVLAGRLSSPKAIKQAVKQWRADHLRA